MSVVKAKKLKPPKPSARVVKGWVVKKSFTRVEKDEKTNLVAPKRFEKTISKLFTNKEAARTFRDLTTKYPPPPVAGETVIEFIIAEARGFDDLTPDRSIT